MDGAGGPGSSMPPFAGWPDGKDTVISGAGSAGSERASADQWHGSSAVSDLYSAGKKRGRRRARAGGQCYDMTAALRFFASAASFDLDVEAGTNTIVKLKPSSAAAAAAAVRTEGWMEGAPSKSL